MPRHCRTAQLQVAANHLVEVIDPDTVDQTLEQQLDRAGTQGVGLSLVHRPVRVRRHRPRPVRPAQPGVRHAHQTPRSPHLTASGRHRHRPGSDDPMAETTVADLPYGNRLGRALCELIEHLPVDGYPQHGVANATIVVTVDEDQTPGGCGGSHARHRQRDLGRGDPTVGLQRRPPPHGAVGWVEDPRPRHQPPPVRPSPTPRTRHPRPRLCLPRLRTPTRLD